MRYPGGKTRAIAGIVSAIKASGAEGPFWEPFCGGLGASPGLVAEFGPGLHSDVNAALIALYRAVGDGWQPPERVSEAEYVAARSLPDTNPMKAFCAVAGSFGGKWFGGYARGEGRNFFAEGRRALLRDVPQLSRPFVASFLAAPIVDGLGFLYCDPPYAGTLPYRGAPPFDSAAFWARAEQWSAVCPVFVSEYAAPAGWRCIWAREQKTTIAIGAGKTAVECLWTR